MNEISKDEILKLKKIGFVIVDNIFNDYNLLKEKSDNKSKVLNELYSEIGKKIAKINTEE